MSTSLAPPSARYVGLDVGTRHIVVAALDAHQQILLQPKKIALDQFEQWVQHNLTATDTVVLDATGSAWHYYDLLQPLVAHVTVADSQTVKRMGTQVKTDARDAVALARLLAAGLVVAVWVPPQPVRELRALITHRQRLIQDRTRVRNRLHSLLFAHRLLPPAGDPFGVGNRAWWDTLDLSPTERLRLRHEFSQLAHLQPLIDDVEKELVRLSTTEPWATQTPYLMQMPGVGVLTAMTVLAAIGDIQRFPTAKKLVGYSGLGASVYATGQTYRTGAITKHGRRDLRTALVEAAWSAIQDGFWQTEFVRLSLRVGRGQAIVAIARKLLVTIWHVLTKQAADRHATPLQVVRKLLTWSVLLHKSGRHDATSKGFVRQHLTQLGLEVDESVTFSWHSQPFTLREGRLPAKLDTG